jgi:hypothetical protein
MKLLFRIICIIITTTIFSCKIPPPKTVKSDNGLEEGKIIAKSFPIDKSSPYESQKEMEEEQLRLRKMYPNLSLLGFIQPDNPWILITENCFTKKEYEEILEKISKECPDAKIVPCDYN